MLLNTENKYMSATTFVSAPVTTTTTSTPQHKLYHQQRCSTTYHRRCSSEQRSECSFESEPEGDKSGPDKSIICNYDHRFAPGLLQQVRGVNRSINGSRTRSLQWNRSTFGSVLQRYLFRPLSSLKWSHQVLQC